MFRKLAPLAVAVTALLLAAGPSARAGGPPPPVEPGDLLGSTGNVGASLIDIDPATGAGSLRFGLGAFGPVTEIEYRSDGVLFGSTGEGTSNILTIDPDTGVETLVGMHAFGSVNGLEFVGDILYGSYFSPGPQGFGSSLEGFGGTPTLLVTVDQTTGALTTIGPITGYSPVRGLAYDESTGTLYGIGTALPPPDVEGLPPDDLFTIDLGTGATTLVGNTGLLLGGLEFGPDGLLYAGESTPASVQGPITASLVVLNPATGAATPVGQTGFPAISGLAFVPEGEQISPLAIPVLSRLGLALLVGLLTLAGLVALRRR